MYWSAGVLILNCLERWSARQKIVGAWSRGMYWSAGALKEKETKKGGWSAGALSYKGTASIALF